MTIDERIQAYYQLHGMGQDLVDSTGRVYAPACEECGWQKRHWKEAGELWVCGHCGGPWPYEDVEVLKGEVCRASVCGRPVPAPRPGEFERRLASLAHLGYHLNAMLRDEYWRWATQVLVGHALTSLTYADVADHANRFEWPTRGAAWTEAGARQRASRARAELRRRLRTRGPTPWREMRRARIQAMTEQVESPRSSHRLEMGVGKFLF